MVIGVGSACGFANRHGPFSPDDSPGCPAVRRIRKTLRQAAVMATERVLASPKFDLSLYAAPAGLRAGVGTGGRPMTGPPRALALPFRPLMPRWLSHRS